MSHIILNLTTLGEFSWTFLPTWVFCNTRQHNAARKTYSCTLKIPGNSEKAQKRRRINKFFTANTSVQLLQPISTDLIVQIILMCPIRRYGIQNWFIILNIYTIGNVTVTPSLKEWPGPNTGCFSCQWLLLGARKSTPKKF